MLKGINVNETVEFISQKDKGNNPTIFLIGNILHSDKSKLLAGAIDKTGIIDISKLQDRMLDIVRAGLKGIKNLDGKDYSEITPDTLEAIPFDVLVEIMGKVIEFNFLKADEEKNL